MNLIETYEQLVDAGDWSKAAEVIQQIIAKNPNIDTSWFNYGVCLDELGRHVEAANAFLRAHELNIQDYGIHFRLLRSFYLAEDYDQFLAFVDYVCLTFPEEIATVFESTEFPLVAELPAYTELRGKHYG
jgi:tetratricopeptide (TPR) repeat protein